MSLAELVAFRENAARIAAQEGNRKQEQAAELLPEIDAQVEALKATKLVVEADKRKASIAKRAATRATRKRLADEEEAAVARMDDGDEPLDATGEDDDIAEELDGRMDMERD